MQYGDWANLANVSWGYLTSFFDGASIDFWTYNDSTKVNRAWLFEDFHRENCESETGR